MRSLTQVTLLVHGKAFKSCSSEARSRGIYTTQQCLLCAKPFRGKENLGEGNGMSWAEVLSRVQIGGKES